MRLIPTRIVLYASFAIIASQELPINAQTVSAPTLGANPVAPVPNPCPRFKAGSVITEPPALYSQNGVLSVRLSY
jgi:hypothetical protein